MINLSHTSHHNRFTTYDVYIHYLFFTSLIFLCLSLSIYNRHGGNFLLLPDGRIGLIDYGATKRLSENERITACVLFVALARKDKDKLWQMAKLAGYKSKHMNPDVYYKLVQFGYDTWGKEVTGGQNVQQFMDDLKRQDPWYETPDNFVLASFMVRMLLLLLLLCFLLSGL